MFKRTFLAIAVGAFLSSGLVQAAPQFGSSPAQAQSSTQAPAAHAAPAATKTNDALINQIAANGAKDQQAVKVLSAKERADSFLAAQVERGVLEAGPGWNEEQQVYIAIGTAVVPMDSIKSTADFVRIRNLKADEAELLAKAEIIRFVRTSMSVENRLVLPQTEPQTDFDKELKALQDELLRTQAELQEVLGEKAEAEGILSAMQQSIIQGLEVALKTIDPTNMTQTQQTRVDALKVRVKELRQKIDALETKRVSMKGKLREEVSSNVEAVASMPLVGSVTLGTFESVVDGQYQISVISSWSRNQEAYVSSLLSGSQSVVSPGKGTMTIGQYVLKLDPRTVIGSRKFLDRKGAVHFIGFGIAPIDDNSGAALTAAETAASLAATANIAMAMRGDVETREGAKRKMAEVRKDDKGLTEAQVAESIARETSAKLENLQLQGVSKRFSKTVQDIFTGQKMIVVCSSISLGTSQIARKMEKSSYQAAEEVTRANEFSRGQKAGMEASLDAVKKDPAAFEAGKAEGMNSSQRNQAPAASDKVADPARGGAQSGNMSIQGGGTEEAFFF